MAQSKLPPDHLKDEIRIVLVGKIGTGKSATGNTLLGIDKFESNPSPRPVTKKCEYKSTFRFGKHLQVVDAPGFMDTQLSKEEKYRRIAKCVTLLSPGIHAILFVIRIGRFTEEDFKAAETFMEYFGPESRKHVITVFTGADDLKKNYDIEKYILECEGLKTFLQESKNRYTAVNNNARSEETEAFIKNLLEIIEKMQADNGKSYYATQMFKEAEEQIREVEAENLKEIEEKKREENEKIKQEALAEYKAELDELKIHGEEKDALIQEKEEEIKRALSEKNAYAARMVVRALIATAIVTAGTGALIATAPVAGLTLSGASILETSTTGGAVVAASAGTVLNIIMKFVPNLLSKIR